MVLFHLVDLKRSKWLIQNSLEMVSDIGQTTSEMRRAPFTGLRVILYLRAGTNLAQPIRVVLDSCIKG